MKKQIALIFTILFSLVITVSAQDDPLPLVNVVYLDSEPIGQRLDVYLPVDIDAPAPTVVILHGGGGNKSDFIAWAAHLSEEGYAVIVPNYRTRPLTYADGFCAIAWTHANAEAYHLDTEHLFVVGFSLGGGLAAEVGMIDSDIDPFADAECPHSAPENWTAGTILLAAASGRLPRVQWQADMEPLIWLDGEEPPFLLIHGDEDRIIPLQRSEQLAAELQAAGVTVELLILPEAGHLFPVYGAGRAEAWQAVDEFLAEQIGLD